MARKSFLPRTDFGLQNFSRNAVEQLSSDPGRVGVSEAQRQALSDATDTYGAALNATRNGMKRGPYATQVKNDARDALVEVIRETVAIIQAYPGTTDNDRAAMRLTIRRPRVKAIPAPTASPSLHIENVRGNTFRLRIRDVADLHRRARPEGVKGATLLYHVGQTPPSEVSDWTYYGNVSRTTAELQLPSSIPGATRIWVIANWFNARSQAGPASRPVSCFTQMTDGGFQQLRLVA